MVGEREGGLGMEIRRDERVIAEKLVWVIWVSHEWGWIFLRFRRREREDEVEKGFGCSLSGNGGL